MSIGGRVRGMFGPHERLVSDLWRSPSSIWTHSSRRFENGFRSLIVFWRSAAAKVQERSSSQPCTRRLNTRCRHRGHLGRLYRGRAERVSFRRVTVPGTRPRAIGPLRSHRHVRRPPPHPGRASRRDHCFRPPLARLQRKLRFQGLGTNGNANSLDLPRIGSVADRDRVRYPVRAEAETMLGEAFGPSALRERATVRPWRNNFALLVQPSP
jgi:hypothetical protein